MRNLDGGNRNPLAAGAACLAVLDRLGVRYTGRGDERRMPCPAHDDNNPSFDLNVRKGLGICRSCGFKSSGPQDLLIAFGAAADFKTACEWLEEKGIDDGRVRKRRDWSPAGPYNGGPGEAPPSQHEQMVANYTADEKEIGADEPAFPPDRLDEILSIYRDASVKALANGVGESGRDYLASRGLPPDACAPYELGFADASGMALLTALKEGGVIAADIFRAGLARRNDARTWSFFRSRVLLPVHARDDDGALRLKGFIGRSLKKEIDDRFKYLNQPGLASSQMLYGLKQALDGSCENVVFVCEGPLDVIQCRAHGFAAVALFGKSMSAAQAQTLLREFTNIVICLDGDAAGLDGAVKAVLGIMPFLRDHHRIVFIDFPAGDDPDSFLRARGRDGMLEQLDGAASPEDIAAATPGRFIKRQIMEITAAPETRDRLLAALGNAADANPPSYPSRTFE